MFGRRQAGLKRSLEVGRQSIACIFGGLEKRNLGFQCMHMGIVNVAVVRMLVVGFGRGSAFVFCPSDVVVEELVVC